MNVQINTNTKLKTKEFIGANLPFSQASQENRRTYNNGNGYDFWSDTNKIFSWRATGTCIFQTDEVRTMPIVSVPDATTDEVIQLSKLNSLTDKLENFLAERFLEIPSVESVFLSLEENLIDIWTVINRLDREVREKIYDVEYDILGMLQDFQFDFHVICRDDRKVQEICPSRARKIFQK